MHEFHLMTQVVKAVEAGLQGAAEARPVVVRLKIRTSSHLLTQDHAALHTAFSLAAQGTRAEGAKLEVIPVSGEAWCPHCRAETLVNAADNVCGTCGGPIVWAQAGPEVMVHEVVVEE